MAFEPLAKPGQFGSRFVVRLNFVLFKGYMKRTFAMCVMSAIMATILTGCAANMKPFGSSGYVDLHADEKGLRAWFDGTNGLIQSGKSDPHQLDNHHKLRGQQEITERHGITLKLGKEAGTNE